METNYEIISEDLFDLYTSLNEAGFDKAQAFDLTAIAFEVRCYSAYEKKPDRQNGPYEVTTVLLKQEVSNENT